MKNLLNKALIYKDWRNAKWITLLMTLAIAFSKLFTLVSTLNYEKQNFESHVKTWFNQRWFNNELIGNSGYLIIVVLCLILLCIVLFMYEKNNSTCGFLYSMPFTRKEIFINKWFVGTISVIISFSINTLLLSLFYFSNLKWIDSTLNPFSDVIKWFFMDMSTCICIFTFFMFVQTVMGHSIASGIIGGILPIVPFGVLSIICDLLRISLNLSFEAPLLTSISLWANRLNLYTINAAKINYLHNTNNIPSNEFIPSRICVYTNYGLKILILLALTTLLIFISLYCFKNRNLEYNTKLISFPKLEPLFKWGVAICCGLVAGSFIGFSFGDYNLKLFYISFILALILGYFIAKKSIDFTGNKAS